MSRKDSRQEFLNHIQEIVNYWTVVEDVNVDKRRVGEGVAFSILCLLDGVSCANLDGYEVYDNETGQRITNHSRELHADIDFSK